MSTRGAIGIQLDNNHLMYTWIGHDADLVGDTLKKVITKRQDRIELVRGGEICSLYENGTVDYYDDSHDCWPQYIEGEDCIDQFIEDMNDDVFCESYYVIDKDNKLRCY